jgi:hypothetical protein
MPVDPAQLPCWTCECPEAEDVQFWLGRCDSVEKHLSPSGWPPGCCHTKLIAVVPKAEAEAARAQASIRPDGASYARAAAR